MFSLVNISTQWHLLKISFRFWRFDVSMLCVTCSWNGGDWKKVNAQNVPVFVCCCFRFFLLLVASYTDISLASVLALIGMCVCVCMVAFNIELAVSCHCTLPINVLYTLSTAFTHSTRTIYRRRQQQKTNTHNTTSNSNSSKYQEVKKKNRTKAHFFSIISRSLSHFFHALHNCVTPMLISTCMQCVRSVCHNIIFCSELQKKTDTEKTTDRKRTCPNKAIL